MVSASEVGFIAGLASNAQAQLDSKPTRLSLFTDNRLLRSHNTIDVQDSGISIDDSDNLSTPGNVQLTSQTASRAAIFDASSNIIASTTTSIEIGFLTGLLSSAQDQLDSKATSIGTPYIDDRLVRTSGTTGNIEDSGIVVDDSNNISTPGSITITSEPAGRVATFATGTSQLDASGVFLSELDNLTGSTENIQIAIDDLQDDVLLIQNLADGLFKDLATTADATTQVIRTIPVSEGEVVGMTSNCTAVRTDGTAGSKASVIEIMAAYRRPAAGSLVQIQTTTTTFSAQDSPQSYDIDFNVNGNNIDLEITGAASQDVDWVCRSTVNGT